MNKPIKPSSQIPDEETFKEIEKYPAAFAKEVFGAQLWRTQWEIMESVRDNHYTSVASCHASGKTFTAANTVLWFLNAYPNSVALTTAPTFRQVQDALWKDIRTLHANAEAQGVQVEGQMLDVRYNLAEDWFALGLSTDKPNRFQAYHSKHMLIIIDESSGVDPAIFDAIEGVGSTGHVRILELGNPTDPTGHFCATFKNPFYNKIYISCFHTPNFIPFKKEKDGVIDIAASTDALLTSTEEERQKALKFSWLIAPQWVYERALDWGIDSPMFYSRCLGQFPLEGDKTLIPMRYAMSAVHKQIPDLVSSPYECLGVDVARYGTDKTVLAHLRGQNIIKLESYARTATTEVAGRIAQWKREHEFGTIRIDDSGVGGGVTDICKENGIPVEGVNVGERPTNTDDQNRFINKRGQYYWDLAQKFKNGEIGIPDHETLIAELTNTRYDVDSKGRIIIESKEEMKKRGMKSPDFADAVMLACFKPTIGQFFARDEEFNQQFGKYEPITAGLRTKSF